MEIIDDINNIKLVFDIIKNSSGSILINCNSGKDRTGVICMLILLLAKVSEQDIIADYEVSYIYLIDNIRKMHQENPNLPKFLGKSKPEYMEKTLKLFHEKYQTIENYFRVIGYNKQEIEMIVKKIIEV